MLEEEVLALAQKHADQAEVFFVSSRSIPVSYEGNRLKSVDTRESSGMALRIIKDGRIGFSSTTDMEDKEGLVARAVEMLPFGARAHLDFPAASEYAHVPTYDEGTAALQSASLVETGGALIDRMHLAWPDVVWEGRVSQSVSTTRLLNSAGLVAEETSSSMGLGIEGTLVRDTDMLFVNGRASSCRPNLDMEAVVAALTRKLQWSERLAASPTGQVPVIFTPQAVAGLLLGPLLAGFNGRNIVQQSSPLIEKLGSRILDPRITVWDDPTNPYIPGSRTFDDEGVPATRFPLVRQGIIANFLYDLQTAGQADTTSTGSAHRGLASQPGPGPSVIVIEPGDTTFADMIAGHEKALVVDSFLGAGQGNILGGDFSANVLLGYAVENGEVTGRVKDTMVAGNVYAILEALSALGSEPEWVGGSLQTPALCCNGVSVSSRG